jgi:hypothetical protein
MIEGHRHDQYSQTDHAHSSDATKANLASPTFTGTPAAPTAAVDTNTTQLATTAFVLAQAAGTAPVVDGTAATGTSTRYARQDHVHPTDTSRAALAGPTFTGVPAAPTAAVDTNTTQLATTAFVLAQAAGTAPVVDGTATIGASTRYARQDHVHPTDTSRAATAGPTFTGTVALPATTNYNGTQLKRIATGVASSTTFTSGTATLSFGTTLPFTPSVVMFMPLVGGNPLMIGVTAAPTTTGVAVKGWTATVAAGSTVSLLTGPVTTIYWVAFE